MKKLLIMVIILMLLATSCASPYDALRLHVIASSDDPADQAVKLMVRDSVLNTIDAQRFTTRHEAKEYVSQNLGVIEAAANRTLEEQGCGYTASCILERTVFPRRDYGGQVYPEGEYEALKVVLGEGQGQNWWCVIFPPLCLVSASEAGEGPVEYRSFIGEALLALFGGKI